MSYNIYSAPNELTSPKVAAALHDALGFPVFTDNKPRSGGWAGFPSPSNLNTLKHAIDGGFDYVYADHAYFKRHQFYRLTKNAKFHTGEGKTDGKRLKALGMRPKKWVKGRHIVLASQSYAFFERQGINLFDWEQRMAFKIQKHTDRPIITRNKKDKRSFEEDLKDAWLLVTHSSNAALDALMVGVPVICTDPCHASSMATNGFENIENPHYPDDRLRWAGVLADNQWTLDEIRKGSCNDLF